MLKNYIHFYEVYYGLVVHFMPAVGPLYFFPFESELLSLRCRSESGKMIRSRDPSYIACQDTFFYAILHIFKQYVLLLRFEMCVIILNKGSL